MPNIRPLSDALANKAKLELDETPEKIESGLANIKEWLISTPHINARTDDQFLVLFLRGCKFSVEKAKEKLEMFYTARTVIPGLVAYPDPKDPVMNKLIQLGCYCTIPRTDSPDAPFTGIIRPGPYDPNEISVMEFIEFGLITSNYLLATDDNLAVAGEIFIYDFENVTMGHVLQVTPLVIQRIVLLYQKSLPLRLKALHFINLPQSLSTIISIAKTLLPEKLRDRLHVHKAVDDLFEYFPRSIFPKEYGGDGGPLAEYCTKWEQTLMSGRDEILCYRNYGIDETKRSNRSLTSAFEEGVEGTFRKLVVD